MAKFYIEFRLHRHAKTYAKRMIWSIAKKFRVKGVVRNRVVPHIGLYGPGQTKDIRKIVTIIERVGQKYTLVPFSIKGFGYFDELRKVIYLDVRPSKELKKLRWELSQELRKVSSCQSHDRHSMTKFAFHGTVAFKDIDSKFNQIWSYIKSREEPNIKQLLLRITVIGARSRIVCEYDLVLKKLLNRKQALSRYWWRKTFKRLCELQGLPQEKKQSILERIIDYIRNIGIKKSIYLIGDTHFDHAKIIGYCNRPFRNVEEMNETMERNWNKTANTRDTVYFLGDWAFGRGHKPAKYWQNKLKGQIVSIKGSHDYCEQGMKFKGSEELKYHSYTFLIIHDPNQAQDWDGWIIHGHKHNNNMKKYPFINGDKKTINVSAELLNYEPVSLDYIISLGLDSIKRMDTIDSKPERK